MAATHRRALSARLDLPGLRMRARRKGAVPIFRRCLASHETQPVVREVTIEPSPAGHIAATLMEIVRIRGAIAESLEE